MWQKMRGCSKENFVLKIFTLFNIEVILVIRFFIDGVPTQP